MVFLYLPVLFLPLFSFNSGTIVAFPIKGWTLDWYRKLGEQDTLIQALWNSLGVGTVVAILSTAMGLFAARAFVRYRFRGQRAAEGLVMLPLVIPGIIVALVNAGSVSVSWSQTISAHRCSGPYVPRLAIFRFDLEVRVSMTSTRRWKRHLTIWASACSKPSAA